MRWAYSPSHTPIRAFELSWRAARDRASTMQGYANGLARREKCHLCLPLTASNCAMSLQSVSPLTTRNDLENARTPSKLPLRTGQTACLLVELGVAS